MDMSKFPKLPDPAPQPEPPAPKPTKEQIFVKPEAPAPEVKAPAPPPAEKKVTFQEPAETEAPAEAPPKKKKQVSQKQLEHLQRMREKANAKRLEKLAEKMPASNQVNTNTVGQTHTVRQTQQPPPTQGIPTSSIPQQNIPIHNIQTPPPPQYVYQQPDMSNFIKRTEVEGIVKNALAQQHQVMLNRAAKIKEEQRVKQEKEAKEQKQKNTVQNLMYPNVRRNKWY